MSGTPLPATQRCIGIGDFIIPLVDQYVPAKGQAWHNAELEAVVALWKQKYGVEAPDYHRVGMSVPKYQWAESILKECKIQDIEPWALIRRFPETKPRVGWYAMLAYFRSHREPLRDGERSFGQWQASVTP